MAQQVHKARKIPLYKPIPVLAHNFRVSATLQGNTVMGSRFNILHPAAVQ
jgi:hypothetical protein